MWQMWQQRYPKELCSTIVEQAKEIEPQDATFFTAWDNLSAGNFLFSGTITGNPYTAGDTYTLASGSLTASLTIAS